jgi:hypothetical protein
VQLIAAAGPAACAELEAWGALPEMSDMLAFGIALPDLSGPEFASNAAGALLALLQHGGAGACERAAAAGALAQLFAVLYHPMAAVYSWSASEMVSVSLLALFTLALRSRERAEWLASQGAVPGIIYALRHDDTAVAATAAATVGVLAEAVGGDMDAPAERPGGPAGATPVVHPLVRRLLPALPEMVGMLQRRPPLIRRPGTGPGEALQPSSTACAALRHLAHASPELPRRIVMHAGALAGLSELLDPACDDGDIANKNAAAIIAAAAVDVGNDDALASALAASTVVPRMLDLLRPKVSSSDLILRVLKALEALAGHRRLHRAIQRAGGAARLKGLQKHPAVHIRDAAALLANNFVCRSPGASP